MQQIRLIFVLKIGTYYSNMRDEYNYQSTVIKTKKRHIFM